MSRVPQPVGVRGSLKWIQILVNGCPHLIDEPLAQAIGSSVGDGIQWLSPLKCDDYAEYRDSAFLERLGIRLDKRPLQSYWPRRGPQWDALGKTDTGKVFLVEAKAHVDELVSSGTQSSGKSREMIAASLGETKAFLRAQEGADWMGAFYQYANRMAHLHLLRTLNGIDAYMVFVYFLNDREMNGPETTREWQAAVSMVKASLGLRRHRLSRYVVDIFIDVEALGSLV